MEIISAENLRYTHVLLISRPLNKRRNNNKLNYNLTSLEGFGIVTFCFAYYNHHHQPFLFHKSINHINVDSPKPLHENSFFSKWWMLTKLHFGNEKNVNINYQKLFSSWLKSQLYYCLFYFYYPVIEAIKKWM